MADVATFVDVEQFLCDHLSVQAPVLSKIPDDPKPPAWVRVIRTGGPRATRVSDRAVVSVEAWAHTETAAIALMGACRTALADLEGRVVAGVNVKDVDEVGGPGNLPHPNIQRQRYTASYEIHLRGAL